MRFGSSWAVWIDLELFFNADGTEGEENANVQENYSSGFAAFGNLPQIAGCFSLPDDNRFLLLQTTFSLLYYLRPIFARNRRNWIPLEQELNGNRTKIAQQFSVAFVGFNAFNLNSTA